MPLQHVLPSTAAVVDQCSHVIIDNDAIHTLCGTHLQPSLLATPPQFDATLHYFAPNNPDGTVQYLLLVDALNFCFWPTSGLEYEHLALGLKTIAEADPEALSTARLAVLTQQQLAAWFAHPGPIPQLSERLRLVHEVCCVNNVCSTCKGKPNRLQPHYKCISMARQPTWCVLPTALPQRLSTC